MKDIALIKKKHWYTIDFAKAIAITLVVIGHFSPEQSPFYWQCLHKVIYSFHMPLFMFASGFLYIASSRKAGYASFLKNKFMRLMIPYFATSFIVITLKLLSQGHANLENPVTMLDYFRILYSPAAGYYLWFIWALWWIFAIAGLLRNKAQRTILFIISIILAYIPFKATQLFCLLQAQNMLVYFMLGVMAHDYMDLIKRLDVAPAWAWAALFAFGEIAYIVSPAMQIILKISLPYIGIIAIMALCKQIENSHCDGLKLILFKYSLYSYGIYLFHTTFEGFAKSFIEKSHIFSSLGYASFPLGAALVVLCGIAFPVLLFRFVLNRTKLTRLLFGIRLPANGKNSGKN